MYTVSEYMALKTMQANAKKAEALRVPKIETGLIKEHDKSKIFKRRNHFSSKA